MPICSVRVFRTEAQVVKEEAHKLDAAQTFGDVLQWAASTFSVPEDQWLLFDCTSSVLQRGSGEPLPADECQLELVQTAAAQLKREERISVAPKPTTAEKDVSLG